MKVVMRSEASSAIGIGHLMRSLALAEALRQAGDDVTLLVCADSSVLTDRWERAGARVRRVMGAAGSLQDAEQTRAVVREATPHWLVLDGYDFTASYRSVVQGAAALAVIDDHGARGLDADLVVNGNLYASDSLYPDTSARRLTGPRYALLRAEFRASIRGESAREGVVVSLGGADPEARTGPILEALAARGISGRVVLGPQQTAAGPIQRRARELGWDSLDAPDDMASLFRSCQIAVVGSGTTALEALALGTPMVAVVVADNQRPVADELARLDLAATADGRDTDAVVAAVVDLLKDEDRMRSMAWRGPAIVDARGALRVAAVMRESTLSVRPASLDDADMLLEWRNDASTRAASFDSACIERDEHMRWLRGVLANPDTIIAVGELERRPFGVIRLDRHGDGASVSVTVAPWARQLGVAAPLIRRALDQAAGLGVARVYAHIRAENAISQRAFHGAGFILSEDVEPGSDSAIVMVAAATSTEI